MVNFYMQIKAKANEEQLKKKNSNFEIQLLIENCDIYFFSITNNSLLK